MRPIQRGKPIKSEGGLHGFKALVVEEVAEGADTTDLLPNLSSPIREPLINCLGSTPREV